MIFIPKDPDDADGDYLPRDRLPILDIPTPGPFKDFVIRHAEWTADTGREDWLIDPHGGSCRGDHDIVVSCVRQREFGAGLFSVGITWRSSVLLSVSGSESFLLGLTLATLMGHEIKAGHAPDVADLIHMLARDAARFTE